MNWKVTQKGRDETHLNVAAWKMLEVAKRDEKENIAGNCLEISNMQEDPLGPNPCSNNRQNKNILENEL